MYRARIVLVLALTALAVASDTDGDGEAAVLVPYAARCNEGNRMCQEGGEELRSIRDRVIAWFESECASLLECEMPDPTKRSIKMVPLDEATAKLATSCCACTTEQIRKGTARQEAEWAAKVSFKSFGEGMTAMDRRSSREIGDCHSEILERAEVLKGESSTSASDVTDGPGEDKDIGNGKEEPTDEVETDKAGDVCAECATSTMIVASGASAKERWEECLEGSGKNPEDCSEYREEVGLRPTGSSGTSGASDVTDGPGEDKDIGNGKEEPTDEVETDKAGDVCAECATSTMIVASGASAKERWEECLEGSGKNPEDCSEYREEVGLRPTGSSGTSGASDEAEDTDDKRDKGQDGGDKDVDEQINLVKDDTDMCAKCAETTVEGPGSLEERWAECLKDVDEEPQDCPQYEGVSSQDKDKTAPVDDKTPKSNAESTESGLCAKCAESVDDRFNVDQWKECLGDDGVQPEDCDLFGVGRDNDKSPGHSGGSSVKPVELTPTDVHPLMRGSTKVTDVDVCAKCAKVTAEGTGPLRLRWADCLEDDVKEPEDCTEYTEIAGRDKKPSEPVEVATDDEPTLESFCHLEKNVIQFRTCSQKTCQSFGFGLSTHSGQNCDETIGRFNIIDAAKQCFATQHVQDVDPTGQCRSGFSHSRDSLFYKHCGCGRVTSSKWELSVSYGEKPAVANEVSSEPEVAQLLPCERGGVTKKIVCFKASAPAESDCSKLVLSAKGAPVKACGCYLVDADGHNAELITARSSPTGLFDAVKGTLASLKCSPDAVLGLNECEQKYDECRR